MSRFFLSAALLCLAAAPATADYSTHPRAQALLDTLASAYGFAPKDLAKVRAALADAEPLPELIEKERTAKEKTLTWNDYRALHITDATIAAGVRVMEEQREWLAEAEARYGIAPAVTAAILGVETKFGSYTGRHRILDALATQGFDHPTRSDFFFRELAEYFAFCREFGFAPGDVKGSYAGAMGAAQFMPSNYRKLAVDFDGDGRRDLWSLPDAIGSIGNYLQFYNRDLVWRRGEPLTVPLLLGDAAIPPTDLQPNLKFANLSIDMLQSRGFHTAVALPGDMPVGLVELPLTQGREFWAGLHNFYAVMTYNPRVFYAMAVAQLAQALQQATPQ